MYLQFIITFLLSVHANNDVSEHAFYISVIEIHHSPASKDAELTIKVFTDDMQDAIRNALQMKESVEQSNFCETYEHDISTYFRKHISISLNQIPTPIHFVSCEEIGDTYQFRFQMQCPEMWNELFISADFLMELFPTQSQMLHITESEKRVTARLTVRNKSQTLTFIH